MVISLKMAKVLLEASEKKAKEMGLSENIAIVDEGGNLKGFLRMDNTKFGGIEIAIDKAWTSVAMQMPTSNLAEAAQPGGPSYGINTTNEGRIVVLGGGVPLVYNQKIVGGIGVSGATSAQDIEVANAAVSVFEAMVQRQHQ
ncbi:GlcG/HbpS family heme-binding protein [Psychrobacillus sp. BM2]|uniref:GlcG/HbpS family heme-binding protein n=1 Tax=Psychrobacillus sp. BM2 TaxID=3400421 RepID=UPI003B022DF1